MSSSGTIANNKTVSGSGIGNICSYESKTTETTCSTYYANSIAKIITRHQALKSEIDHLYTQIHEMGNDTLFGMQTALSKLVFSTIDSIPGNEEKIGNLKKLEDQLAEKTRSIKTITEQLEKVRKETSDKDVAMQIVRAYALTNGQKITFLFPKIPDHFFIANAKGDVFTFNRTALLAKGANRYIYKGTCQLANEPSSKEIAITTTLEPPEETTNAKELTREETNRRMRLERDTLAGLRCVSGVIQVIDSAQIQIDGKDYECTITDLCIGDVAQFLQKPNVDPPFDDEQKNHFTTALLKAFSEIHKKGIHRDVKPQNILVRWDAKTGYYEPVIIDFEYYISKKDEEQKKHPASTKEFWPPEYRVAMNSTPVETREHSVSAATTKGMDLWALGIVLDLLWNNRDLTNVTKGSIFEDQTKYLQAVKAIQERLNKGLIPQNLLISSLLEVDPLTRQDCDALLSLWKRMINLKNAGSNYVK